MTNSSHCAQEFTDCSTESLLFQKPLCLPQTGLWVTLEQQFSNGSSLPPREHLAMSVDTLGCHNRVEGAVGSW